MSSFKQRCESRAIAKWLTNSWCRFEAEAGKEGMQNRIRICILLKHWVANFWDDFDEQFIARFTDVIKNVVQPVIASSANIVLQLIEKKVLYYLACFSTYLGDLQKQGPPPKQVETPRKVALTADKWTPDNITAVPPVEIAKQLTMMGMSQPMRRAQQLTEAIQSKRSSLA